MLRFLLEKECKQLVRNPLMVRLILVFPVIMMLIMPWAANMEVKKVGLAVVDHDRSVLSRRLTGKFIASDNFQYKNTFASYEEALELIEKGGADVIVTLPPFFERDVLRSGAVEVQIAANAVNGMKGGLGSSYAVSIVNDFGREIQEEAGPLSRGKAEIRVLNLFNPHMDYKVYMVPALMVMLLTIICGFLPAFSIVTEKEKGTIEQINVTPVGKFSFILAKLIPFWIIGFLILNLCFGIAWWVYGITPAGSIVTIYLFSVLYIFTVSGLGLVISNYSDTMQQAVFVIFFCVMILILTSGLFTPVRSMPDWAQVMTLFNPLKYFILVMRQVYLKGSNFSDLYTPAVALLCFASVFNLWAVVSYRKRN